MRILETLVLDCRRSGATDLEIGEAFDDANSRALMDLARSLLVGSNGQAAEELLGHFSFGLYGGTNILGDKFIAALPVSPRKPWQKQRNASGITERQQQRSGMRLEKLATTTRGRFGSLLSA